jgi:hypothetical protein
MMVYLRVTQYGDGHEETASWTRGDTSWPRIFLFLYHDGACLVDENDGYRFVVSSMPNHGPSRDGMVHMPGSTGGQLFAEWLRLRGNRLRNGGYVIPP